MTKSKLVPIVSFLLLSILLSAVFLVSAAQSAPASQVNVHGVARITSAGVKVRVPASVPQYDVNYTDSRILADIQYLAATYDLKLADSCGGPPLHAAGGEHPLCDAADFMPARNPTSVKAWARVAQMATDLGWRASCARSGCVGAGGLAPAVALITYNGFPGAGDPAHSRSGAHIHVSWKHAPVTAAAQRNASAKRGAPVAAWVNTFAR